LRVTATFHAIDCDVQPAPPAMRDLLPCLEEYWRESVVERGIPSLEPNTYPPRAPISARPEWRGGSGLPEANVARLSQQVFGRWGADRAICNCLYGVELLFSEDMAAAFARALNDWIAKECLDRDPRLRASIMVPTQNIEFAVDEIERCAKDRIVRDHVRLTMAPFDAPDEPDVIERTIDHLGSDAILLHASDFPHWQFDGDDALPPGVIVAPQDPRR
jgi:predicted TIM-barrel fold metal-dependent hydrolase